MKRLMLTVLTLTAMSALEMGADAAAGKAAYDKSCKSCHGATGVANPAIVKMTKVPIKDLGSSEVQELSAAELKKIISEGKGKMKPVKTLTGDALDGVVAYVHTLKK